MVTKSQKEQMLLEIMDLLLPPNSAKTDEILNIVKQNHNVSETVVRNQIYEARDKIKEMADYDRDMYFAESLHCLSDLYDKTFEEKKYRDALEVRKELHKLLGLNAPTKQEISGTNGEPLKLIVVDPRKKEEE